MATPSPPPSASSCFPSQTPPIVDQADDPSSTGGATATGPATRRGPRRRPGPSSFRSAFLPVLQPKAVSVSSAAAPSVAQGRSIRISSLSTADRTSALRELNINFPSRHSQDRYAKSTGATSSEPVIVRTYSPPPPPSRRFPAPSSQSRIDARPTRDRFVPHTSVPAESASSAFQPSLPFGLTLSSAKDGLINLVRGRLPVVCGGHVNEDDGAVRLPSLEAFSFKSFLDKEAGKPDATAPATTTAADDMNASLYRIAEICARSRYSLSNQYEVHFAPLGSGSSFLSGGDDGGSGATAASGGGLTLQAVPSDDEASVMGRRHRRRRVVGGGRGSSRAVGTLETIMSSSRSSEEERANKKKSAAEIAAEVRARVARQQGGSVRIVPAAATTKSEQQSDAQESPMHGTVDSGRPGKRKLSSLATALLDMNHQAGAAGKALIVSKPALPHTSTGHLQIRTLAPLYTADASACSDTAPVDRTTQGGTEVRSDLPPKQVEQPGQPGKKRPQLQSVTATREEAVAQLMPLSLPSVSLPLPVSLMSWVPRWMATEQAANADHHAGSLAEGSLRHLLRVAGDERGTS